jgi:hypothetical protein
MTDSDEPTGAGVLMGIPEPSEAQSLTTFTGTGPRISAATHLTLAPSGISINLETGEVTLPPGLTIRDAAREFWEAVQHFCPHAPERNRGFGT